MRYLCMFMIGMFLLAPLWVMAATQGSAIGKTFVVEEASEAKGEEAESYACTSSKYNLADAQSYLKTVKTDAARDYAEGLVKRAMENVRRSCS